MSKERELLLLITKRFQEEFNNSEWYSEVDKQIIAEIDVLLAEPEPLTPRQGLEEYKKGYAQAEQDLKRKPLSDEAITALDNSIECAYVHEIVVRLIEKAHGIGD